MALKRVTNTEVVTRDWSIAGIGLSTLFVEDLGQGDIRTDDSVYILVFFCYSYFAHLPPLAQEMKGDDRRSSQNLNGYSFWRN